VRRPLLLALVACLVAAGPAAAEPGDLIVADEDAFGGGGIMRIDPDTGVQSEIASDDDLPGAVGVAVAPGGEIFVADYIAFTSGAVFRVNPATGAASPVSSGDRFDSVFDVAYTPGGLLVANPEGANTGVIHVNPATGVQTQVSDDPAVTNPVGIAVGPAGGIFVADNDADAIFLINPADGSATPVSSGGSFANPARVAVGPGGEVYVADNGANGGDGAVFRINLATGAQTPVAMDGFLTDPFAVAVGFDGSLFVLDFDEKRVVRVNPVTGSQTPVSTGGNLSAPEGIAIEPNRSPTASLTVNREQAGPRRPVTLDGSASSDPDGPLARYEWDLDGDGSFETGTGATPTVTHSYLSNGTVTPVLRVSDPHGGSATASATLTTDATRPRVRRLRATPASFTTAAVVAAARRGTTFRYRLSERARVTLTIQRRKGGRFVKAGVLRQKGKRGRNRRRFSGRLRGKRVKPGSYRAVLRATDPVGNRSRRVRVRFAVRRP
jgi:streptogramin lyase